MLRCILKNIAEYVLKIFSNCVFCVKTTCKQWLQVFKSVNYLMFTH